MMDPGLSDKAKEIYSTMAEMWVKYGERGIYEGCWEDVTGSEGVLREREGGDEEIKQLSRTIPQTLLEHSILAFVRVLAVSNVRDKIRVFFYFPSMHLCVIYLKSDII